MEVIGFAASCRRASLLLLGLAALASPARAQWPTWLNKKPEPVVYPDILVDAKWLKAHIGKPGVAVVDAQVGGNFHERIRGALSFDTWPGSLHTLVLGTLRHDLGRASIPPGGTVVVYTSDRFPLAAGDLFFMLELAGHKNVRILNGGLEAWKKIGGETTETSPGPSPPTRWTAPIDTSKIADLDWVRKHYGRRGITMLDPRPEATWEKGHVPQALAFDFEQFKNDDGTEMDGPSSRPILAAFGPRARDPINLTDEYVVTDEGKTVHPYLALRLAGIPQVRLWTGTFDDWKNAPGTPVTRLITTSELAALIHRTHPKKNDDRPVKDFILFDLRHDPDFVAGHIPGAILLTPDRFDADVDSVVAANWPGADRATIPFIVYCYGPDCVRSRNCSTMAAHHGFRNLLWYHEGPPSWRGADEPWIAGERK